MQRQKLVGSGKPADFGAAVAVDRGMILVGAPDTIVPGREPPPDDFLRVSGVVYGFVAGQTRYVEAFKLEQRLDEFGVYRFGHSIAMRNDRIAVGASDPFDFIFNEDGLGTSVLTYSRDGSIVRPLGIVDPNRRLKAPVSVAIANNVLLIGSPLSGHCPFQDACAGRAWLTDLSRLTP